MIIHTPKTFCKYAYKQISTYIGIILAIILFISFFHQDLHILIHNVLISSDLANKIVLGLTALGLIAFNRFNHKDDNDKHDT